MESSNDLKKYKHLKNAGKDDVKESSSPIKYEDVEGQDIDLFWKPEDYGFKLEQGDGKDRGSRWIKDEFILIRLSETLWLLKKKLETKQYKGNKIKLVTKWHMVIDRKSLADLYFTSGLRG